MGIADEAFPNIALRFGEEQNFDLAMGVELFAHETGGDDLGVIANQDVAGLQIFHDVVELFVLNRFLLPVNHHEPALIAFFNWGFGRSALRAAQIEKIDIHLEASFIAILGDDSSL
jgi:hypothetical protein